MAAMPFMPLYIADYLSDAAHLSTLEHGAYLLLIMTYWQKGGPLPDDDKKLARITRLEPRTWKRLRPAICEFFEVIDGKLLHSRVERELSNVRAKSLKKRNGGLARAKQMHSSCSAPAQLTDTDTDTYSTVAKATGAGALPAMDSDKEFWATAKAYIGGKNPGALIGKWVGKYGKAETAKAITAAQVERAVDPIPYIARVLAKSDNSDGMGDFIC